MDEHPQQNKQLLGNDIVKEATTLYTFSKVHLGQKHGTVYTSGYELQDYYNDMGIPCACTLVPVIWKNNEKIELSLYGKNNSEISSRCYILLPYLLEEEELYSNYFRYTCEICYCKYLLCKHFKNNVAQSRPDF